MKTIKRSDFKDMASYRDYAILRTLADSEEPIGSWNLKDKLDEYQVEVSIASIGRYLKDLDQKGYTKLIKNQGRQISVEGSNYLNLIEEDLNRFHIEKELIDASNPSNRKEFLELLHARKVLEIETARLAAIHATQEDIEKLEHAINSHYDHIKHSNEDCPEIGCNFHVLVGQASHNRFLCSTLKLLIHEEMELEKKFPYPATLSQGRHYIEEHREILDAIIERDTEKVTVIMEKHMTVLIDEIKSFFAEGELKEPQFWESLKE